MNIVKNVEIEIDERNITIQELRKLKNVYYKNEKYNTAQKINEIINLYEDFKINDEYSISFAEKKENKNISMGCREVPNFILSIVKKWRDDNNIDFCCSSYQDGILNIYVKVPKKFERENKENINNLKENIMKSGIKDIKIINTLEFFR